MLHRTISDQAALHLVHVMEIAMTRSYATESAETSRNALLSAEDDKTPHDEAGRFLEHRLFTSLTVIRSSAEILRDNPEIGRNERQRFLEAMLHEERKIEQILQSLLRNA